MALQPQLELLLLVLVVLHPNRIDIGHFHLVCIQFLVYQHLRRGVVYVALDVRYELHSDCTLWPRHLLVVCGLSFFLSFLHLQLVLGHRFVF